MSAFASIPVHLRLVGWPLATTAFLGSLLLGACTDSAGPEPELSPVGAVALDASKTELGIGEAVQIIATVLDTTGVVLQGRSVTWSSSDAAVVSVTGGGLVDAVGPGIATVTAMSGGVSGELSFTVLGGACRAEVATPTAPGQIHEGNLATFDCRFPGGQFADGWVLTLTEQTAVVFTLESSDFDAVLLATDTAVTTGVAFDDNSGGGTDALMFHVFQPGTYLVWATSYSGETGAYRLTSSIVEIASCDTPVGSLGVGGSVTHALTITSCVHGSAISDRWSLSLSEDVRLRLALSSYEFDTVLEITNAEGQRVAFDDDGGTGTNSLIQVDLTAGDYTVWVSSYSGRQTGTYSLTTAPVAPLSPPPTLLSPAPGAVLDNGCFSQTDTITWDFDWSDTEGASRYHLYVIHPGAQYPVIDLSSITDTAYRHARIAYIIDTNRFGWTWRVRALVGGDWTAWSEARSFDIEPVNTDCEGG
jgi:hypothetical protein